MQQASARIEYKIDRLLGVPWVILQKKGINWSINWHIEEDIAAKKNIEHTKFEKSIRELIILNTSEGY